MADQPKESPREAPKGAPQGAPPQRRRDQIWSTRSGGSSWSPEDRYDFGPSNRPD